jgi:diadenosine tetraphosphatase ApaH/serine/threonine PP2A family protein phosphatase
VEGEPARHAEIIDWFLTLPLWLDLPELQVVHACWHAPSMEYLAPTLRDGHYLTDME